jgi:hypothetical protein
VSPPRPERGGLASSVAHARATKAPTDGRPARDQISPGRVTRLAIALGAQGREGLDIRTLQNDRGHGAFIHQIGGLPITVSRTEQ